MCRKEKSTVDQGKLKALITVLLQFNGSVWQQTENSFKHSKFLLCSISGFSGGQDFLRNTLCIFSEEGLVICAVLHREKGRCLASE